jgi:hypothetical protein
MNPLSLDPTRTTTLRRQFNSAIIARFNIFKRELQELLIKGDALGLKVPKPFITFNAEEWRFLSPEAQMKSLEKWLAFKAAKLFLSSENRPPGWLEQCIKQGYGRGLKRSYVDWRRPTETLLMTKEMGEAYQKGQVAEFMRHSFGGPVPTERVRVLATRSYNDLAGVTEQMNRTVSRTLMDGMIHGLSPRAIGSELNKVIDGSKRRGTAIARTEIIRAFNEGALDGYEEMGAKAVGVMVEWTTSGLGTTRLGNPSPCSKCAPLANLVLTIDEARGMLPRHPNCMCSFIPANVGEKSTSQIRDAKRIRAAITQSARGDTRWLGAKTKIASRRPKNLV